MKHKFTLIFLLLSGIRLCAQLHTTASSNRDSLAYKMVNLGVSISNIQLNCPSGASGFFSCDSCSLNMANGVLLTTGQTNLAEGPNNTPANGWSNTAAGYSQLNQLAGATTHDACILEFDMKMLSDSIEFRYIFGSEEYPEFVFSGYNDAFAFWVSGPGITGEQNIALVPDTTSPITIDNVNNGSNSQYYILNGDDRIAPYNTSSYYIQYDGLTTMLTAKLKGLLQFETYHLKMAIADAGDDAYDSGVFIEANSLSSNGIVLQGNNSHHRQSSDSVYVSRTCGDGLVRFRLLEPRDILIGTHFAIGGSAVNGVDYQWIADSINIQPGDSIAELHILTNTDSVNSAEKTVVIYLLKKHNNQPYDSLTLVLYNGNDILQSGSFTSINTCSNNPFQLSASTGNNYNWLPDTGLSNNTIKNPVATNTQSITYKCTVTTGNCITIDTVEVNVLHNDATFTIADSTLYSYIFTPVGTNTSYSWNFGDGTTSTAETPIHTYSSPSTYQVTLTATDENGCSDTYQQTITITDTTTTGLHDLDKTNIISIQPNPTSGIFSVVYNKNLNNKTTLTIYNMLGSIVTTQIILSTVSYIDTQNWPLGVYLIEINDGQQKHLKKLVKK